MNKTLPAIFLGYITYCSLLYCLNRFYNGEVPLPISSSIIGLLIGTPMLIEGYQQINRYRENKRKRSIRKLMDGALEHKIKEITKNL